MKKIIMTLLVCFLFIGCETASEDKPAAKLQPQVEDSRGFHFVVMGDNRPWWNEADIVTQNEHFRKNIELANELKPDFVVIVGDLIYGYTDDEDQNNEMWDFFDEACEGFEMPIHLVIGNHDVWNEQSRKIWEQRYGPEYYSWDHKGCHFIALNSEVVGQANRITSEQLEWLKRDLANATGAERIFVFVHKPLWAESEEWNKEEWNEKVHPLLAKYGVDTVFAGHWHQYMLYPEKDGVRYVITGGAGAETGPYELAGDFFHLLDVRVEDSSSSFSVVTANGRLPADCVTYEKVKALEESLVVKPLDRLPEEGEAVIEIGVRNPTNKWIKAVATIESGKSDWYSDRSEVMLEPGESKFFTVDAHFGENVFPLPKSKVELVDGEKKLFGWENFVMQAFVNVVPETTPEGVLGELDNAGFEDGTTDGWTVWGGSLMASVEAAHTGNYSGYMSERTDAWQGPVRDLS